MRKKWAALALCVGLGLLAGCARGRQAEPMTQEEALKQPLATAIASLEEMVQKVEAGDPAAGREAYQIFAHAFGQVLGPVSFKDAEIAQWMANANSGLQEALAQKRIDGESVRQQAESLLKGLSSAAAATGDNPGAATAVARLVAAPARVIEVTAREYRFEPRVIEVKKGETVTIRLKNAGTEKHEWESEALRAEIKPVAPGSMGEVTFTAPNRAGTYEFGCFLDQHFEKGMRGFVVVK